MTHTQWLLYAARLKQERDALLEAMRWIAKFASGYHHAAMGEIREEAEDAIAKCEAQS